VALAIPLVQSLSKTSKSSQDTASVASGAAADSTTADRSAQSQQQDDAKTEGFAASSNTTSSPSETTVVPAAGADLGTAETPQALTALVQGAAPTEPAASDSTLSSDSSAPTSTTLGQSTRAAAHCDPANRASHPDLGALRYTATATYQSIPVEIAVYDVADSTAASSRLIATAVDDCRVLLDQLIP
jgi:hypothetical protein